MSSKPTTYKRLMVQKLTSNFRNAVFIETSDMCHPLRGEVRVKNKYVGVNASDVNMSKGRYFAGDKLPFGLGMEAVGEIDEIGDGVENLKIGQYVAYFNFRCTAYAEYTCINAKLIMVLPEMSLNFLGLLVCGLTASIGLDKAARIKAGDTVLITSAAGGTGHIAVQWAKSADCHVIGTCSTEEKAKFLKDIGCDRIVKYKNESLSGLLSKEYPNGVNVAWETIGGQVFEDCLNNLSIKGRLVIVGSISEYKTEEKEIFKNKNLSRLPEKLVTKSAAVEGFYLPCYEKWFSSYIGVMTESMKTGKLKIFIDNGEISTGSEFFGMEGIIRGVEHQQSGKNIGKVITRLY